VSEARKCRLHSSETAGKMHFDLVIWNLRNVYFSPNDGLDAGAWSSKRIVSKLVLYQLYAVDTYQLYN